MGTSEVGPSSPPVREEMDKPFRREPPGLEGKPAFSWPLAMGGSASEAQDTHQVAE